MNASRKLDILKYFDVSEVLSVKELAEKLGCSESSVRRDLIALDKQGLIKKVHGGAVRKEADTAVEDKELSVRMALNPDAKKALGAFAGGLVKERDTVYLDAGTTVSFVIDALNVKDAVFVTNSHPHAERLAQKGYKVFVIGGEYKAKTGAYVGTLASKALEQYHFDKGFFGTNGISPGSGFSTPDEREAEVKRAALLRCEKAYVLADATKFDKSAFVSFASLSEGTVITDDAPEKYSALTEIIGTDEMTI